MSVSDTPDPGVHACARESAETPMAQAPLQIDFSPRPRGVAVVTSAPISAVVENGNYLAFQDLIDGYAASFSKVFVISPYGESTVTPSRAHRVTWLSGPRVLSPTSGLLWTAIANRRELREVELVRTFGPQAGIAGRVLSRMSKSPHVSSSDDLVHNAWRHRTGLRAVLPRIKNRLGLLRADVISATLEWEIEYLADMGYKNDLLFGTKGLATDIYTPVGMTDPDRHPVVLWAGKVTDHDSISLLEETVASTQKVIENVEFVVIVQGDEADLLNSTLSETSLPVTAVTPEEVEPLVDLIERTWACVTAPVGSRRLPQGLAMLALSAGVPLISMGELGEKQGFQNHLNYMGVERDDSEAVASGLRLYRKWTAFALRIGSAGQRLVEDRFSTRVVALQEGEQLARIASDRSIESETSAAAGVLEEFELRLLPEVQPPGDEAGEEADSLTGPTGQDAVPDAEAGSPAGFDMVASALADIDGGGSSASAGESVDEPAGEDAGGQAEEPAESSMSADMIAALFDEGGESIEVGELSGPVETVETPGFTAAAEIITSDELEVDDGLPPINVIKVNFTADSPEASDEGEEDDAAASGELDQDDISALFAANDDDEQAA